MKKSKSNKLVKIQDKLHAQYEKLSDRRERLVDKICLIELKMIKIKENRLF